jgi:hypothetical protein
MSFMHYDNSSVNKIPSSSTPILNLAHDGETGSTNSSTETVESVGFTRLFATTQSRRILSSTVSSQSIVISSV